MYIQMNRVVIAANLSEVLRVFSSENPGSVGFCANV